MSSSCNGGHPLHIALCEKDCECKSRKKTQNLFYRAQTGKTGFGHRLYCNLRWRSKCDGATLEVDEENCGLKMLQFYF